MKLVALCVLACGTMPGVRAARADVLREYAANLHEQRATSLREASCDVDVELRGAVAHVTMRRAIENGSKLELDADYETELPAGAVIDAASVRLGARESIAAVRVPRGFDSRKVEDRGAVGEDPLLVSAYDDSRGVPHYRAVLQAIAPGTTAELTVRWTAVAEIHGGAIALRVPGRGREGELPACRGHVTAAAGPGATIARVQIGDAAAQAGGKFELGAADADIRAELAFESAKPVVWTARAELAAGWATELVTEVAPVTQPTAPRTKRAVFVIDRSRSMAMIGDAAVERVVGELARSLPHETQTMVILFDRTAETASSWQPSDQIALAVETALHARGVQNGSDLGAALALARQALTDAGHDPSAVFVITDGGLGSHAEDAKTSVLAGNELHAIVLTPPQAVAPDEASALRASAVASGGSYAEVSLDHLDAALSHAASWVQPSWTALELGGVPSHTHGAQPVILAPGEGASIWFATRGAAQDVTLSARHVLAGSVHVAARGRADASLAALALDDNDFPTIGDDRAALARRGNLDADHVLVALATAGRVASQRRAMIVGGGPYTRLVAAADPAWGDEAPAAPTPTSHDALPSAIQRITLERLFRDQLQLPAYACYERALTRPDKFNGTVQFQLEVARGEVMRAATTPTGDDAFDHCLLSAAYAIQPPYPDFRINADDETVARYPLTFKVDVAKPIVILGDADSSSPIDIESIGKAPVQRRPVEVDTKTPLGGLAPAPPP